MDWSEERRDGAALVEVGGRIDEQSWEAFMARMESALADSAAPLGVILDLARIAYISSRGLRALTILFKKRNPGQQIVFVRPTATVREVLEISRYDQLFPIYDDTAAALRALGPRTA